MAEVNPPPFLQSGSYDALSTRRAVTAGVRSAGILKTGDLIVEAAGTPNDTVTVLAGEAFVQGDQVSNQGLYYVYNDGPISLTLNPGDSVNDRIDSVFAKVYDATNGDASDSWELMILEGTAELNPSRPVAPNNAYRLADIRREASTSNIADGDITNEREFASMISDRYSLIHGHRRTGVVGTPPSTLTNFIIVSGTELSNTDGNGEVEVDYPDPPMDSAYGSTNFPNGVMSVVASAGFASPAFFVNINHGGHTRRSFVARCHNPDGTDLVNTQVRINYIAVGW